MDEQRHPVHHGAPGEPYPFGPPPIPPPPPRPRWPLRLAQLYLVALCCIGVFSRWGAEQFWPTNLLLYVPQVVYALPAALTVPIALLMKDARALLANGLALAVVAGPLMGCNIPTPQWGIPERRPHVRVLAYNIKGATESPEGIRAQLARFRPDVVIFSEASGWADDAKLLKLLKGELPGWDSYLKGEVFLASRWPMTGKEGSFLGTFEKDVIPPTRYKVRAVVHSPVGAFNLVGVHFRTALRGQTITKNWRHLPSYLRETAQVRRDAAADVLRYVKGLQEPVILGGDFNTPPAGHIYGALTRDFNDAFGTTGWGWGFTYPSRNPMLRIDYVFYDREWKAIRSEVGGRIGSDHRPLFAELARVR